MVETYQVLQYVSIPLTFFGMLICTLLPWKIRKFKNSATYMTIGSCFGSGVILGAAFSHMVPGSMEAFETYFSAHEGHEAGEGHDSHGHHGMYPWPMLICIVVLLLLITVDTVANSAHDKMMGKKHDHGEEGHQNHLAAMFADRPEAQTAQALPVQTELAPMKKETEKPESGHVVVVASTLDLDKVESASPKKCESQSTVSTDAPMVRGTKSQVIQAYIFFVALSLHAITDGMSIGAEENSTGFYGILIAVVAHKALDGFALGVPLYYANLPKFHTIFAIIFCCCMTPLGIGIGIAAIQAVSTETSALAKGIVLSISMGSFLFITLWEMLPAGLNHGKHVYWKLLVTFLGWGLMALLALWV